MRSPVIRNSNSGLELSAGRQCWGHPASGTSRLVTTARLLCTTLSLSVPVDFCPVPSPPVSCSKPITQNTNTNKR